YLWLLNEWDVDEYLILSGDHLYRMDYSQFIRRHRETGADITLSVVPVDDKKAPSLGLMKIDHNGRVIDFSEKPKGDALKQMQVDTTVLGLTADKAKLNPYIASMGIYVFKKEVLHSLLNKYQSSTDFGKEIIPDSAKEYNLQAYLFDDYWEDIGTIEAFYDANLALTKQPNPDFSFYDEKAPIYTRGRSLPPTKMLNATVTESMIGEGCIVKDCRIHHSVLGIRSRVEAGCTIEDTLVMGNDFYESSPERESLQTQGKIAAGIGSGTTIRRAIIDKNARIGKNVMIVNTENVQEANREELGFYIRNGIVVVIKNMAIADGTII
ncbi:MAG: Glucose-phosphate adenylyltransferase, partial [Cyanobacteriota bacterium]